MESFALDVLNPLVRGQNLERNETSLALCEILEGSVDGVLIASFLTAITMKGETVDEMTGFIDAMISCATTFSIDLDAIDIVGTGGDQLHSVNVSTMAALSVAGCGVPVAKHGNRAASSSVGSADLLEALGVRIDAPEDVVRACILEAGFGFMFAPGLSPRAREPRARATLTSVPHHLQRAGTPGESRARPTFSDRRRHVPLARQDGRGAFHRGIDQPSW